MCASSKFCVLSGRGHYDNVVSFLCSQVEVTMTMLFSVLLGSHYDNVVSFMCSQVEVTVPVVSFLCSQVEVTMTML